MPSLTSRKSPPGRKPPASAWNAFRRPTRRSSDLWPSQQRRADRGRALFFILCTFSLPPICYPKCAVRMLWWFLILGVSAAVVVSVAFALYMRVRRQMKRAAAHRAELDGLDHSSPPEV